MRDGLDVDARPDVQPWAGHAALRRRELAWILEHVDGGLGVTVEIGCGNGLAASVLAQRADAVIATDLPFVDPGSHALGLSVTKTFLDAACAGAVLVGCGGQDLPFDDDSVDTVFMLYSLEHVPDRPRCLAEVERVLRPGGRLITVVPTAASSVFYPVAFYAELARRTTRRIVGRARRAPSTPQVETPLRPEHPEPVVHDWASFRAAYPHFPAPSPHGEFGSYVEELRGQRVARWEGLVESSGLTIEMSLAMSVVPVQLMLAVAGRFGERLHARLDPLDRRICRRPWSRHLAQGVCIVARSPA